MRDKSYEDYLVEVFRNDPAYALEMLNEVIEEGALDEAIILLHQIHRAFDSNNQPVKDIQPFPVATEMEPTANAFLSLVQSAGLKLVVQPA